MISLFCLLVSSILFFILKYRVHIHVEYTAPKARSRSRAKRPVSASGPGLMPEAAINRELLVSALHNLGCKDRPARAAAARAAAESPDFNEALKLAINYATRKEAA